MLQSRQISAEENIIVANNLGAFYRFINKRIANRSNIGPIINANGQILTDSTAKANVFNAYFSSVGIADNGNIPVCTSPVLHSVLDSIVVAESDVLWSISRLKINSSSGPDNIPPLLFARLKYCLCYPLTYIFNQLLSVGFVPPEWKNAFITPVHKKGATGAVQNYRPISLTCVASKILERIVCRKIVDHLHYNNILHQAQHGFLKRRSTTTNLLEYA